MKNTQYNDLTEKEAEMIDYDYFNVDNIDRHLALVRQYRNNWHIDEIIRVEVRNQMFRELCVDDLYDYFHPLEGWSKTHIQALKLVIKASDMEVM